MRGNTIELQLTKNKLAIAGTLFQYDYGQRLVFSGTELPPLYEVHFSNNEFGNSKTSIGDETGVDIPDEYLTSGKDVHVWVFLHDSENDGETEYHGIIHVAKRAKPTNEEPTPEQQDVITQAIAALNEAVEQCDEDAAKFDTKADKADTVLDTTLSIGRKQNSASGNNSVALGTNVEASGNYSFAQGSGTRANGDCSHAEGSSTIASANCSHAEGGGTTASGNQSHAEGAGTTASGNQSHAEGTGTTANGNQSHAEGGGTTASGLASHAEGGGTIANHLSQHAFGLYNIADPSSNTANKTGNYVEIVGNGTSNNDRSNARTLDWFGNERIMGDLYIKCNEDSSGGIKVDFPAPPTSNGTYKLICVVSNGNPTCSWVSNL